MKRLVMLLLLLLVLVLVLLLLMLLPLLPLALPGACALAARLLRYGLRNLLLCSTRLG